MKLPCCGLPHPHWGSIKVLAQVVIFILWKVTFNFKPNPQALTQWASTTATTMAALTMVLLALVAWAMVMVPTLALVAMVMAVATFVPVSMEDTGPLDFTEKTVNLQWSISLIQNSSPRLTIFTPVCYWHEASFFNSSEIMLSIFSNKLLKFSKSCFIHVCPSEYTFYS